MRSNRTLATMKHDKNGVPLLADLSQIDLEKEFCRLEDDGNPIMIRTDLEKLVQEACQELKKIVNK